MDRRPAPNTPVLFGSDLGQCTAGQVRRDYAVRRHTRGFTSRLRFLTRLPRTHPLPLQIV